MSKKFPGGFITKSPTAPSSSAATGIWTLEQAAQYKQASAWPTAAAPEPSPGGLWSVGSNSYTQLGQSIATRTVTKSSPVQVGALSTWSKMAGNDSGIAVIKSDGTLWAWGNNKDGQCGLDPNFGNQNYQSSPIQVGALTTWSKVSAGGKTVGLIKTNGTMWAFGNNYFGQIGDGQPFSRSTPSQIGALTNWAFFSMGDSPKAIKTDGTLWSWGSNAYGQIGDPSLTVASYVRKSSPIAIGALTTWAYAWEGSSTSFAIKTDGTLWSWGRNNYGQLGFNDRTNRNSPVQVGSLTNWSKINTQTFSSFAIKTDGTLWSWGRNDRGQLGQNDRVNRSSPVQIGALTNWSIVRMSGFFCAAIKTDGSLWTWGSNDSGQLAQNDVVYRSSPVQVGALTTWQSIANSGGALFSIKT